MRKKRSVLLLLLAVILGAILLLNKEVSYQQGINYKVYVKKIPLYLKLMDYFSRHFHYKILASEIIEGKTTDLEKILALFEWTHKNIKSNIPDSFPIIDDHVLNIIIRGYGVNDQLSYVFTTFCVYAGIPARAKRIFYKDKSHSIVISIVYLNGRRLLFDPYFGNCFINESGQIASIKDILLKPDLVNSAPYQPIIKGIRYREFFAGLSTIEDKEFLRGRMQMPFYRLIYELGKLRKRIFH